MAPRKHSSFWHVLSTSHFIGSFVDKGYRLSGSIPVRDWRAIWARRFLETTLLQQLMTATQKQRECKTQLFPFRKICHTKKHIETTLSMRFCIEKTTFFSGSIHIHEKTLCEIANTIYEKLKEEKRKEREKLVFH